MQNNVLPELVGAPAQPHHGARAIMLKKLDLPLTTEASEHGPVATFDAEKQAFIIRYDNSDKSPTAWVTVTFSKTLAAHFFMANEASLIPVETDSFGLHVTDKSVWIDEITESHRENSGDAAAGALKLRHFYLDFDHWGYFEIIAEDYQAVLS